MALAHISGFGSVTPLGWRSDASCAAIRAGISGLEASDSLFDRWGEPLVVAALPRARGIEDEREMDFLIRRVLDEAASTAGFEEIDQACVRFITPTADRPESRFTREKLFRLVSLIEGGGQRVSAKVVQQGPAGFALALREAANELKTAPGIQQFILGIDSMLDLEVIEYLEQEDRVKDSTRPRGLFPGEACAAIALSADKPEDDSGCAILGVGVGREHGTLGGDVANTADGATKALWQALSEAELSPADIGAAYLDLNGEEGKAHEWGVLWARALYDLDVVHPADCVGDVGAATMPLLAGLASTAWSKRYATAANALLMAGSDDGLRACVVLSRP